MGSAEQLSAEHGGPAVRRPAVRRAVRAARFVAVLLAREAVLIGVCLAAWSLLPAALGLQTTTVMSDSMAPGIRAGDVVVSRPVVAGDLDGLALGAVLLVVDPDRPDRLRLHRWVGQRDGGLLLQGDANPQPDSSPVAPGAVRGAGFLRIPAAGLPVYWIRTGQPGPLVAAFGAGLVVVWLAAPRRPAPPSGPRGGTSRALRRRRVLAGAAVALIATSATAEHAPAWATFSKTAVNPSNSLKTAAFDCPARTRADFPTPSLYYSYMGLAGSATSSSESDLSANAYVGKLGSAAMRRTGTCGSGNSPYVTLTTTSTYVYQALPAAPGIAAPAAFGISAWFRTSTGRGKIAGFGDKGSGNSTTYDRHVYMGTDGRLTFGVQTDSGRFTCTSTTTFADGQWHLVVATYAAGALTMWTDDGQPECTATATGTIIAYNGYWQFGNDTLSTSLWPNASASNFIGDLDETGVYGTQLTLANARAIYAVGR